MFNINYIFGYYAYMRKNLVSKRPWAHYTKKGPGRKHQQGKAQTKEERNGEV
jgi:hypothetical protein